MVLSEFTNKITLSLKQIYLEINIKGTTSVLPHQEGSLATHSLLR